MVPADSNTKQKKPDLKVIPGRKNIRKKPRKGKGKGKSKKKSHQNHRSRIKKDSADNPRKSIILGKKEKRKFEFRVENQDYGTCKIGVFRGMLRGKV